ncbi:hypothetical protein C8R44DRAFT_991158 [Mycena epipterygia]|nr:hypothetical protein C8R44DRAFT_991158 [Mycena epipterygia]
MLYPRPAPPWEYNTTPPHVLSSVNAEPAILEFLRANIGQDPSLKAFAISYNYLVHAIIDARLHHYSKKIGAQAIYLTGLAGVAAFLALAQIGFVLIIGNPDCGGTPTPDGCDPHSRLLRNLANFLSYIALSFDTLGSLSSLLTARTLFYVGRRAQDLMDDKCTIDARIIAAKDDPARSRFFGTCIPNVQGLAQRVDKHSHIISHHTGGQRGVIYFIMLGILCFFAALILHVIASQPRGLWIPFIWCVILMATVLAWTENRAHPGMWPKLRTIIQWDEEPLHVGSTQLEALSEDHSESRESLFREIWTPTTRDVFLKQLLDTSEVIRTDTVKYFIAMMFQGSDRGMWDSDTIRALARTLSDEDVSVRCATFKFFTAAGSQKALSKLIFEDEWIIVALLPGLSDKNLAVKRAATQFFAATAEKLPIPFIQTQLINENADIRRGAVEFFAVAAGLGDNVRKTILKLPEIPYDILKMLEEEQDRDTRRAAINFLTAASVTPATLGIVASSTKLAMANLHLPNHSMTFHEFTPIYAIRLPPYDHHVRIGQTYSYLFVAGSLSPVLANS